MPNDETKFYKALENVVGPQYLLSKNIGRKITKNDLFLDKDYRRYSFPSNIENLFSQILEDLNSSGKILTGSLSHNVDGIIQEHPKLKTRIIEFDEEQHFNPFRQHTILKISSYVDTHDYYFLCSQLDYYKEMLIKHRIEKSSVLEIRSIPNTPAVFQKAIANLVKKNNGYVKKVDLFDYIGGRIAQRAYYDTLRLM